MNKVVKIVFLVLTVLSFTIWSQIPQTMSYQGVLLDNADIPLNGSYTLMFKLYYEQSGGTVIWQESKIVDVSEGIFNVILGSNVPLNLSFDQTYYLGITVGVAGTELQPRIELTSSAYALNAKTVEDSSITTSKLTEGAVIAEKIAANQVVKSINSLTDSVQLVEGSNITIVPSGNSLIISADASGTGGNTLDQAYDQGGAGAGRTIIADSGPFEVSGTDGALFSGTYLSGSIPFEGEGTRMMWYPGKAAFRSGGLSAGRSTFWDDDSIGHYSFSHGYNTKATGNYSTAFGWTSKASGTVSSAFGHSTIASGYTSTAFGREIEVSGDYSFGIALSDQNSINVTQDNTMAIMGGNVGIGTTTPDYPLSIFPGNADRGLYIEHIKTTSGGPYAIYANLQNTYSGSSYTTGIFAGANSSASSGSTYGIHGSSSGSSPGSKIGVYGYTIGSGTKYAVQGYSYSFNETDTHYGVYGATGGFGTRYGVYSSGDLAYSGSLIHVSDRKLKNNEHNLSGILPKLMRLQSKSYNFNTEEYKYMNLSDGLHYGIIAQELEKEFPELVVNAVHPGESDEKGNHIGKEIHYLGVNSIELIPLLLQGMKEQQEIIENLQKRIEQLERK